MSADFYPAELWTSKLVFQAIRVTLCAVRMDLWPFIPWLIGVLLVARWLAQWILAGLNTAEARRHESSVPERLKEIIDEPTYRRSIEYTVARERFDRWDISLSAVLAAIGLFSGLLPALYAGWANMLGNSAAAAAGFLFLVMLGFSMARWPLDWREQFSLEARFGFNTMTPRLWWHDRLRGIVLSLVLLYPLLVLLLHLAGGRGDSWWLWAWLSVVAFQAILLVAAPVVILPLFNRLTPLEEGDLKERLLALTRRVGFRTRGLQVMDGSRRSKHSNAFFAGLGRFRRIVLFDTLLQQLEASELEAVVAHEIGHYRHRHVRLMLIVGAAGTGIGFFLLGWLASQEGFYRVFGYPNGELAAAFLLFGLASGVLGFWLGPLSNALSRRFEYQADAYAARMLGTARPLISALRKLSRENLSNLNPHWLYSLVYYSHPTLVERESALSAGFPLAANGPGTDPPAVVQTPLPVPGGGTR